MKHGFGALVTFGSARWGDGVVSEGTVCTELRGQGGQDQIRPGKRSWGFLHQGVSEELFSEDGVLWSDT